MSKNATSNSSVDELPTYASLRQHENTKHPNFDPSRQPILPDRPLTDIPDPVSEEVSQLKQLYGKKFATVSDEVLINSEASRKPKQSHELNHLNSEPNAISKWQLIESEPLAEHLALMSAAQLIELPPSFYTNHSEQTLLNSLDGMTLLDMADINAAMRAYPNLSRYGMQSKRPTDSRCANKKINKKVNKTKINADKNKISNLSKPKPNSPVNANNPSASLAKQVGYDIDELSNSSYADDWEVILYPERFDTSVGNNDSKGHSIHGDSINDDNIASHNTLATDLLACSVAVYVLQQCDTRKTINTRYSASDICHYLRSYVLSQINLSPLQRQQYRCIRLFAGHVIVAAHYLGWQIDVAEDGTCYFNISSRCGLLARYPNLNDYHINGWLANNWL